MQSISKFFKQSNNTVTNESGTAIIATLLILVLLTLVSMSAIDTTTTEKAIVRSEAIFERSFYYSESAAMEGIQKMENVPVELARVNLLPELLKENPDSEFYNMIRNKNEETPEDDLKNFDKDDDGKITGVDGDISTTDPTNSTFRAVVQDQKQSGISLDMAEGSTLFAYVAYGYSEASGGKSFHKLGYRKRF